MNETYLIKAGTLVNEGTVSNQDILIRNECIEQIGELLEPKINYKEINAYGKHLFPGVIDDQVHFREPGLLRRGDLYGSKSGCCRRRDFFMEMPNVQPQTLTQTLLEDKYQIGKKEFGQLFILHEGFK